MENLKSQKFNTGFTLVELISVMVILGIVGAIGSGFMVSTIESYNIAEKRAKIISKGRVAIEQVSRQLRLAVPNSVRVSASGNCIEFFPITGGANYLQSLPDGINGAPRVSSISTSPFFLGLGSANHVVVAPFFSSEIYSGSGNTVRAAIGALGVAPYTSVPLASSHRFLRNSIRQRLFVADDPRRFCLSAGNLLEFSGYGVVNALNDTAPSGGANSLIAKGVESNGIAFSISPGSEDRNTAINMSLRFFDRGEGVTLNNTVLVRNVP